MNFQLNTEMKGENLEMRAGLIGEEISSIEVILRIFFSFSSAMQKCQCRRLGNMYTHTRTAGNKQEGQETQVQIIFIKHDTSI